MFILKKWYSIIDLAHLRKLINFISQVIFWAVRFHREEASWGRRRVRRIVSRLPSGGLAGQQQGSLGQRGGPQGRSTHAGKPHCQTRWVELYRTTSSILALVEWSSAHRTNRGSFSVDFLDFWSPYKSENCRFTCRMRIEKKQSFHCSISQPPFQRRVTAVPIPSQLWLQAHPSRPHLTSARRRFLQHQEREINDNKCLDTKLADKINVAIHPSA